jgi:hypothetical protein
VGSGALPFDGAVPAGASVPVVDGGVTGAAFPPPLTGASSGALEAVSGPRSVRGLGTVGAGAAVDEPLTCRSEMAATRSLLRIRAVPGMPSSPARRCSSGSSMPDRPLPRRRERAAPASAAPSVDGVASLATSTRSVVSLTYRSFPAVTCACRRRG